MRTDEQYETSDPSGEEPADSGLAGRISARLRRALERVWGVLTPAAGGSQPQRDTDTDTEGATLPATVDGADIPANRPDQATRADREIPVDDSVAAEDAVTDRDPGREAGDGPLSSSQADGRLRIAGDGDEAFIESDIWEEVEQ
jgi:hypothetical protein